MSDNKRRETASTDPPHPARHPRPPQRPPAPRGGTWPDARTAEILLSGEGWSGTPPTVPADRLVRLLAAARDGHAPPDPAREAAALAAFRTAAAGRPARAAGGGWGRGGPLAALRSAFAARRPRMMAAAVVSALALGGVAVGMAAAARSFTPGEGAGTAPPGTRPPAAVSPDGSTAGPWTAGPGPRSAGPAAPPVHGGADEHRHGNGGTAGNGRHGNGNGSGNGSGNGYGSGYGPRHRHSCHRAQPGRCPHGHPTGTYPKAAQPVRSGSHGGGESGSGGAMSGPGKPGKPGKQGRQERAGKQERVGQPVTAEKGRSGAARRHIRPGRRPPSRARGR